jgi:hypothetical protein
VRRCQNNLDDWFILTTPLPTQTPESTLIVSRNNLVEHCQTVENLVSHGEWDAALQRAEEIYKLYKNETDLSREARAIESQCSLHSCLEQAGVELTQAMYNSGQYSGALETIDHTNKLLGILNRSTHMEDNSRSLKILYHCTSYQQHVVNEEFADAEEALSPLQVYSEQSGFYNDFYRLCKLSYDQAKAITSTIRAAPSPCQPKLPRLVHPTQNARYQERANILFRWHGGRLCDGQVWQVVIDENPSHCQAVPTNEVQCYIKLSPGAHEWRVEIRGSHAETLDDASTHSWTFFIAPIGFYHLFISNIKESG